MCFPHCGQRLSLQGTPGAWGCRSPQCTQTQWPPEPWPCGCSYMTDPPSMRRALPSISARADFPRALATMRPNVARLTPMAAAASSWYFPSTSASRSASTSSKLSVMNSSRVEGMPAGLKMRCSREHAIRRGQWGRPGFRCFMLQYEHMPNIMQGPVRPRTFLRRGRCGSVALRGRLRHAVAGANGNGGDAPVSISRCP